MLFRGGVVFGMVAGHHAAHDIGDPVVCQTVVGIAAFSADLQYPFRQHVCQVVGYEGLAASGLFANLRN